MGRDEDIVSVNTRIRFFLINFYFRLEWHVIDHYLFLLLMWYLANISRAKLHINQFGWHPSEVKYNLCFLSVQLIIIKCDFSPCFFKSTKSSSLMSNFACRQFHKAALVKLIPWIFSSLSAWELLQAALKTKMEKKMNLIGWKLLAKCRYFYSKKSIDWDPSKHDTLVQYCFTVDPPSATVGQR